MHVEQYDKAQELLAKKRKLRAEESVWTKDLTGPHRLGYQQRWNNDHPVEFENTISDAIFQEFRDARMQEIAGQIAEIEMEFSKL